MTPKKLNNVSLTRLRNMVEMRIRFIVLKSPNHIVDVRRVKIWLKNESVFL